MSPPRWWAYAVTLGVSAAVVWPALAPGAKDSFPLSTYPMFAKPRGLARIVQLVGVDASGNELTLGPELLGTREVLQAKVLIQKAARSGKAGRRQLCRKVAAAIAEQRDERAELEDIRRVQLMRVVHHPLEYFTQAAAPRSRKRLVRCRVKRAKQGKPTQQMTEP